MKSITKSTFEKDVLNSEKIVLFDAWAPWCPPCRGMLPIVENISEENSDWIDVVKLNVDEEMELAQTLGVTGLPTFFVYKNGKIVNTIIGATTKDKLIEICKLAK